MAMKAGLLFQGWEARSARQYLVDSLSVEDPPRRRVVLPPLLILDHIWKLRATLQAVEFQTQHMVARHIYICVYK